MKIVIDIDEKDYCNVKNELLLCYNSEKLASKVTKVFQESIPLSQMIKKNQNIQPETKTGEWVQIEVEDCTGSKGKIFCCSKCNEYPRIGYWGEQDLGNFCPNCGADMRIKAERENKK